MRKGMEQEKKETSVNINSIIIIKDLEAKHYDISEMNAEL